MSALLVRSNVEVDRQCHYTAYMVPPLSRRLLTVQISRNARSEKTSRRDGERAAEIDHASKRASMEDVEAVLLRC